MKDTLKISFAGLVLLLFMITSICRLATSIYLPALPIIGDSLHLEESVLGLTLTVYFFGFSFFTLVAGPLSDAWGRRRVLLIGAAVFMFGSLVCATAQGGTALLAGRLLQAIGACSIPVTSRALVRDAFEDQQVITVIGWMGVLGAIVPSIAPILGGAITEYIGWRYTFGFLAFTSFFILLTASWKLPETLPEEKRHPLTLPHIFKVFLPC
ncbi:MFS transporter [Maridesulfovibrio sp.]|uniref:MFS transporter n=1 Tax=Maridesulfovibrio sp. TaxID=2795000 RepID=UPI0039F023B9